MENDLSGAESMSAIVDQEQAKEETQGNGASPAAGDIRSKVRSQFNEEKWTRLSAKNVSISRFRILEVIFLETVEKQETHVLKEESKEHIEEYPSSLSARYFLGMLALKEKSPDELYHLKNLLEQFQELSKWAVVDYLCDKMLEQSENRAVLRAKSLALEKLGKTKEAIPVLEKLAQVDRRNPDIAFKYADAIISEDIDKGLQFYKQAAELYAKNLQFDQLKTAWGRIVDLTPEDFPFYRKIERILLSHRQKDALAELYVQLVHQYIKVKDLDNIIFLCKRILDCNPNYTRFKNELLRSYREKYKDHSLLEDFIKYSNLLNAKKSVSNAIQNFEINIVFDKDNYVFHRSWGVGKIKELTTEEMVIDFKDKDAHRMNIEMALKSLKPLKEDHFLVHQYEKPHELATLIDSDRTKFFKILLSSFGNRMSLTDLKTHVCDHYILLKDWSKWWTKTRTEILKDNLIEISPQRKDIIELREIPITPSEKYIEKFQSAQNLEERVNIAVESQKEGADMLDAIEYIFPSFKDSVRSIDRNTRIQSFLVLEMIDDYLKEDEHIFDDELKDSLSGEIESLSISEGIEAGKDIVPSEILKRYIKWLKSKHPDWRQICLELFLHLSPKNHKLLIVDLIAEKDFDLLNQFFINICKEASRHPTIFLSGFRSLVYKHWDIADINFNEHLLTFFRLTRVLQKIEIKGTKLKGIAKELIAGNGKDEFLQFIAERAKSGSVRKIVSLLREVSFLNDLEKGRFINVLISQYPDEFKEEDQVKSGQNIDDLIAEAEKKGTGIASQDAISRMKGELDRILQVEIPDNSKEIGIAQEKGDLRENAEYKAAMERQTILQATVTRLESELKNLIPIKGVHITKDSIVLGSKIKLRDVDGDDLFIYSIMDRWDADIDSGIISYQSPLGKALLKHKVGDIISFGSGEKKQKFEITEIGNAVNEEGVLI